MPVQLTVPDDAIARLKPLFVEVEGSCEAWTDDEVVRRMLVRGAMEYAKSAGRPFAEVTALAGALRELLV